MRGRVVLMASVVVLLASAIWSPAAWAQSPIRVGYSYRIAPGQVVIAYTVDTNNVVRLGGGSFLTVTGTDGDIAYVELRLPGESYGTYYTESLWLSQLALATSVTCIIAGSGTVGEQVVGAAQGGLPYRGEAWTFRLEGTCPRGVDKLQPLQLHLPRRFRPVHSGVPGADRNSDGLDRSVGPDMARLRALSGSGPAAAHEAMACHHLLGSEQESNSPPFVKISFGRL